MSEPTISQQILDALADIYSAMSTLATNLGARIGWTLTDHLNTDGNEIRGKALDDDDYAPPLTFRAYADGENIPATEWRYHRAAFPSTPFVEPPFDGILSTAHDGKIIAANPTTAATPIVLSGDIPAPTDEARWSCLLVNEALPGSGFTLRVTAQGGVTMNGDTSAIVIDPGESRMISRRADGFRVL
jgi:hypothetical protein